MPCKIAMFCGGSGAASISLALFRALSRRVELTLLVNCYDDGKSTGELRRAIPGMLGPSDIRKNVARFSRLSGIRELLERRVDLSTDKVNWHGLGYLGHWVVTACRYLDQQQKTIDSCPLGNLIFVGIYLTEGNRNFNKTVTLFSEECQCMCQVLNITDGQNLRLSALRENDERVYTEAEISTLFCPTPITQLSFGHPDMFPAINNQALVALADADLIVYGPGTQHSSLLPSYMTRGVREVIGASCAPKVYVVNSTRDFDTWHGTVAGQLEKLMWAMHLNSTPRTDVRKLVTHTLVDLDNCLPAINPIFNPIVRPDWVRGGRSRNHDGEVVADYLLSLVP